MNATSTLTSVAGHVPADITDVLAQAREQVAVHPYRSWGASAGCTSCTEVRAGIVAVDKLRFLLAELESVDWALNADDLHRRIPSCGMGTVEVAAVCSMMAEAGILEERRLGDFAEDRCWVRNDASAGSVCGLA